ncbi:MAG: hypothetical protein ACE5EX_10285 [Phycisphaerae bacterium]
MAEEILTVRDSARLDVDAGEGIETFVNACVATGPVEGAHILADGTENQASVTPSAGWLGRVRAAGASLRTYYVGMSPGLRPVL